MFYKIGVIKIFAKFTGKHLYWSLFLIMKKERDSAQVFPENFERLFRTPFLQNTIFWGIGNYFSLTMKRLTQKLSIIEVVSTKDFREFN